MFFSKYIKIIFITLVLIFISINIPIVYAQDNTAEVQKESIESTDKYKVTETSKEETEEDESDENDSEYEHVDEHGHEHKHEQVHTDLTGENAEFGREEHRHDHEHDECEYFHKAWREPGTIDIMKKYCLILFSLFGIIVIYRLISNNFKK